MGAYGFYDALEQVCFAEERGFASVSWPEAHGISYNTPSPMLSLAAVASHTSRIMLGTSVIIASQYNPVRIAEEAAMLDVISNGRFTLGAAIGYRPYDFELPPSPHVQAERRPRPVSGLAAQGGHAGMITSAA